MLVSREHWAILVEVLWLLMLSEVGLRLLGMRKLVAMIAEWGAEDYATRDQEPGIEKEHGIADLWLLDAEHYSAARLSHSLLSHLPFRITCLTRSLVVFWLLRRREAPVRLVLGVKRVSSRSFPHAWVELRGKEILEPDRLILIPIARLG